MPASLTLALSYRIFRLTGGLRPGRNGNAYPVKAAPGDETLTIRVDASGKLATLSSGQFAETDRVGLAAKIQSLAEKTWNKGHEASWATILLFLDRRAPWPELLETSRLLVELRVPNLLLVTRDGGDTLRLLPLKIDLHHAGETIEQTGQFVYRPNPDDLATSARLQYGFRDDAPVAAIKALDTGKWIKAAGTGWGNKLGNIRRGRTTVLRRVQFDLQKAITCGDFAEAVNKLADLGVPELEPFWPALYRKAPVIAEPDVVPMAALEDQWQITERVEPPTAGEFWRSAGRKGLTPHSRS